MAGIIPINHQDPNVIVSITAEKIGMKTLQVEGEWARANKNVDAKNGINTNPETYKLLYDVLEATACLSVSQAKLQVVAVALHVGKRWGGSPMLTIAENCNLRPGLKDHITLLWARLREMSRIDDKNDDLVRILRTKVTKSVYQYSVLKNLKRYKAWLPRLWWIADVLDKFGGIGDLKKLFGELEATYKELVIIETHVKSLLDQEKAWNDLTKRLADPNDNPTVEQCELFSKELIDRMNNLDLGVINDPLFAADVKFTADFEKFTQRLETLGQSDAVQLVNPAREFLWRSLASEKPACTGINWDALIIRMDEIMKLPDSEISRWEEKAREVYNDPALVEWVRLDQGDRDSLIWAKALQKGIEKSPIARGLGKLTTQDRHTKRLFFASDLLGPLFVTKMSVRGVPETTTVDITLPRNQGELGSIVEAIYRSIKPRIKSELVDAEVVKVMRTRETASVNGQTGTTIHSFVTDNVAKNPYKGVVHCECALVAYLENPRHKLDGQFNYIGVSKLSCGACHSWLMAFNSTRGNEFKYYTAGTHGKWYHPWAIPPSLASQDLKNELARIVCGQFVRYCNPNITPEDLRDLSGSTHAKQPTVPATR